VDVNERLAREVMGWKTHEHMVYPETHFWYILSGDWEDMENCDLMLSSDWNPLQDRNHTALVLEKFSSITTDAERIEVIDYLSHNPHTCAQGGGEFWAPDDYWYLLTADPAIICKAIIEVLGQNIKTESADL